MRILNKKVLLFFVIIFNVFSRIDSKSIPKQETELIHAPEIIHKVNIVVEIDSLAEAAKKGLDFSKVNIPETLPDNAMLVFTIVDRSRTNSSGAQPATNYQSLGPSSHTGSFSQTHSSALTKGSSLAPQIIAHRGQATRLFLEKIDKERVIVNNTLMKTPQFNASAMNGPQATVVTVSGASRSQSNFDHANSFSGRQENLQCIGILEENNKFAIEYNQSVASKETRLKSLSDSYNKDAARLSSEGLILVSLKSKDKLQSLNEEKKSLQEQLVKKEKELQNLFKDHKLTAQQFETIENELIFRSENFLPSEIYNHLKGGIFAISQAQRAVNEAKLALLRNEIDIASVQNRIETNDNLFQSMHLAFFRKEIFGLQEQNLDDCKKKLAELNKELRELSAVQDKLYKDWLIQKEAFERINKKIKSAWASERVQLMIEREEQTCICHSLNAAWQATMSTEIVLNLIVDHEQKAVQQKEIEQEIIIARETAPGKYYQVLLVNGVDVQIAQAQKDDIFQLTQLPENLELIKAIHKTFNENGATFSASYNLSTPVQGALENLGIDTQREFRSEFVGNHVQHFVHNQLLDSLNKISDIQQLDQNIQNLLKSAVEVNLVGQDLNNEHKVVQALAAKHACDTILEYAKAVADLGVAAVEGAVQGVTNTAEGIVWAVVAPPAVKFERVRTAFNHVTLVVSKFVAMAKEDFRLQQKGDPDSLKELSQRRAGRDQYFLSIVNPLIKKAFLEMSLRDQVKAVSQFATQMKLFKTIGAKIGQFLEMQKQIVQNRASIKSIISNPYQALFGEVAEIVGQREPALLKNVINFIEKDSVFIAQLQELNASPSGKITKFFTERAAACEVIEKLSSIGIKTRGESLRRLLNVSKDLVSLQRLEYIIERYHKVPGFTGQADAVLERILKVGRLKPDGSGGLVPLDLNSAKGTLFEAEAAIKLETDHGMKITEFGAKYKSHDHALNKNDPLDFDLATHDTLIECKNGNLNSVAIDADRLKNFIRIIINHKETAEQVAQKKYLFVSSKPLHELLKDKLKLNNINFLELL